MIEQISGTGNAVSASRWIADEASIAGVRVLSRCPRRTIQTTDGIAVLFWILISVVIGATIPFIISLIAINESAAWWIIDSRSMVFLPSYTYASEI